MSPASITTDGVSAQALALDRRSATPTPGPAAAEAQRLRELFTYLFSLTDSTGYPGGDIDDEASYEPTTARLSSDPVLNALAQLSVHRLQCERAFVSLIDDTHQYIMAEATRGISLSTTCDHPPGHGLCIGARPIDLVSGVCAGTMPAFLSPADADQPYLHTDNIYADTTRYIISNFALEDKYKDRPYVTGFPFMRFYAEVPIKTHSGYVIGTLAVIDNKPRRELQESEYRILVELSNTIMVHIEKVKMEQEHIQALKLLRGLNAFLEPNRTIGADLAEYSDGVHRAALPLRHAQVDKTDLAKGFDLEAHRSPSVAPSEPLLTPSTDLGSAIFDHWPGHETPFTASSNSMEDPGTKSKPTTMPPFLDDTATELLVGSDSISEAAVTEDATKKSFQHAAKVLRIAMRLEGVAFLDAVPHGFESHHDTNSYVNNVSGGPASSADFSIEKRDSTAVASSVTRNFGVRSFKASQNKSRMAPRLGFSRKSNSSCNGAAPPPKSFSMPEIVVQSLLRHYPHGHVLDFSHSRKTSSGQELASEPSDCGANFTGKLMTQEAVFVAIRDMIPDVRSAIFVPLWSVSRGSWFSGGLGWTTKSLRVLQRDDLAYFSVFGNSLMAEVARLDLLESDRAKSDFISSISHELRSPLHGILGTTELMRESAQSPSAIEMIDMVENCGQTLLDTVDHILDYAKIRTSTNAGSQSVAERNRKHGVDLTSYPTPVPTPAVKTSWIDLDDMLEKTVESMVISHRHSMTTAKQFSDHAELQFQSQQGLHDTSPPKPTIVDASTDVTVVLDIGVTPTWRVETDVAAWRRIFLNLIGNALKYTEHGLIRIGLRVGNSGIPTSLGDSSTFATLTVTDTGRGISRNFLRNHLFTPFAQENGLSVGTGLGLSIVKNIVKIMNGSIHVESEVSVGTEVKVTVPLHFDKRSKSEAAEREPKPKMCLVDFNSYPDLSSAPTGILSAQASARIALKSSIESYAEEWMGLEVLSSSKPEEIEADLIVIPEASLPRFHAVHDQGRKCLQIPCGASLIVISATGATLGTTQHDKCKDRLLFLKPYCGPHKMKSVVNAALAADRSKECQMSLELLSLSKASPKDISSSPENTTDYLENVTNHNGQTPPPLPVEPGNPKPRPEAVHSTFIQDTGINLLIVDDNDINRKILATYARKLKCSYATAKDGQDALDQFIQKSKASPNGKFFTCILMDLSMPVMDGFATIRAIRGYEAAEDIEATPVIALTGLTSAEAQKEALACGADLFLTKPLPLAKIRVLVEQGLEGLMLGS